MYRHTPMEFTDLKIRKTIFTKMRKNVNSKLLQFVVLWVCLSGLAAIGAAYLVALLIKCVFKPLVNLYGKSLIVGIGCTAMIFSAMLNAGKPAGRPTVEWDEYLTPASADWVTNGVGVATGVSFTWTRYASMPSSETVYIQDKEKGGEEWTQVATATASDEAYTLTLANATNYTFKVYTAWMPPTPVHTNGVWLGTILEKAKGVTGCDKIVVVNGKILENGATIAPKKEEE